MPEERTSPISGKAPPKAHRFTSESAAMNGGKGGEKTQAQKKKIRLMRDELEALLKEKIVNEADGKKITIQRAITVKLIESAMSGSIHAYEVIRDTIGQKPSENVNVFAVEGGEDIRAEIVELMKQKGIETGGDAP